LRQPVRLWEYNLTLHGNPTSHLMKALVGLASFIF
jgi:hypothetical protein